MSRQTQRLEAALPLKFLVTAKIHSRDVGQMIEAGENSLASLS